MGPHCMAFWPEVLEGRRQLAVEQHLWEPCPVICSCSLSTCAAGPQVTLRMPVPSSATLHAWPAAAMLHGPNVPASSAACCCSWQQRFLFNPGPLGVLNV